MSSSLPINSNNGANNVPATPNADGLSSLNLVDTATTLQSPSRNTAAANAVDIKSQPVLLAQAIVPRQSLPQMVKNWNRQIVPVLVPTKPAQPGVTVPLPGSANVGRSPVISTPVTGNRTPQPVNTVFSPQSDIVKAPGVPQFSGKASASVFSIVNAALPESRIREFALLSPAQQTLARTMLSAGIAGLQAKPGSTNYVAPGEFKTLVSLILDNARNTKLATAPTINTLPTTGANRPPVSIPGQIEVVPPAPRTVTPAQQPPAAPVVVSAAQVPPATPAPVPGAPVVAAQPTTIASYPLSGPVPAWWADAIKGSNGQPDAVMARDLSALLTDATEYRRQADTINLDRAVDPAKSTLTPRQEWARELEL